VIACITVPLPVEISKHGARRISHDVMHGVMPSLGCHLAHHLSAWYQTQFPNGIVSSVSFVSTPNTARSLAGSVLLALALTP
jgi:hypothetical protein